MVNKLKQHFEIKSIKYKKILFVLLLPLSLILIWLAKHNIGFAEFYSTKIYPIFAKSIGFITGLVPVSVGEIFIVSVAIAFIFFLILTIIKTIKDKSSKHFKIFTLNIIAVVSCIYFLYVLFCGMNYYRYEFTAYSGLEIKKSSTKDLINLCDSLINDANELRVKLNTDESGVATLYDNNIFETSKRAQNSFNNISNKYEILKGSYPKPKPIFFSKAMSHMQITGMFFPFTFESNVNVDIPSYQIPATMCHELVHIRGFMREDEANFLSYLTCISSGYDDFAYSGTMLALTYSMNALYSEDYDAFVKLHEKYSQGLKSDMKYTGDYWEQFQTKIAEISHNINDTYLKANNQVDGVKSYGRMVDLLLALQATRP